MGGLVLLAGALAEPEAKPEGKSDADALVYYNLHGYWPVWYSGYHLIGKRSAEADASQKANLMLMLGCTILPTDTGHHGITVTISVREVLMLSQKANLMPMPGYTITPMDTGQLGTLDTT